jgi:hypothetical protein
MPARPTASNAAWTNERLAGRIAISEVWLINTWPVFTTHPAKAIASNTHLLSGYNE